MHLDLVTLADANELAWHVAAERPERIADAVGKPPFELPDFQIARRPWSRDRAGSAGDVWRVGQNRALFTDNRIVEIVVAGGSLSRPRP